MLIPDGWHSTELGKLLAKKLAMLQTGPFGTVLNASEFVKHGIPIISVREIRNGYIQVYDETPRLSSFTAKRIPKYLLKHSDLVFARKGSVGRCALIQGKEDGYFLGSDAIYLRFLSKDISPQFILHYLHSYEVNSYLVQNAYGTTMAGLNEKILSALPLQYPSAPKEQEAIAEALSDADGLIASLQKLITKKKAIKQGMMQELLTGKRRLPGFDEKWDNKQLADICEIINGGTPSTSVADYWGGNILWCTPTDITACSSKYIGKTAATITRQGQLAHSLTILPPGTILLCSRATIGEVRIAKLPITTNQGFKSLIAHKQTDNEWLYYVIITLKNKFLEKAIGSTFLEISKNSLARIPIRTPSPKEQTAIARVLSDMDTEIEQLEKKLSKYQQIKQGMMQELLTGRIRLIATEPKQN